MMHKEQTGLIVVDIQGKLAHIVDESEALIANSTTLIKGAKTLNLPIIWLEQNPEKLGSTLSELSDELTPNIPITKYTFSACGEASFIDAIKKSNCDTWLICGIEAHICVYQTSIDLLSLGFNVELVTDCIASRTTKNKELAIAKLAANGASLTSLEMCLFELLGDCLTPDFKEILRIIK